MIDDDGDDDETIFLYSLGYRAIKCYMHSTCSLIREEAEKQCGVTLSLIDSMTVWERSASLEIENILLMLYK